MQLLHWIMRPQTLVPYKAKGRANRSPLCDKSMDRDGVLFLIENSPANLSNQNHQKHRHAPDKSIGGRFWNNRNRVII